VMIVVRPDPVALNVSEISARKTSSSGDCLTRMRIFAGIRLAENCRLSQSCTLALHERLTSSDHFLVGRLTAYVVFMTPFTLTTGSMVAK